MRPQKERDFNNRNDFQKQKSFEDILLQKFEDCKFDGILLLMMLAVIVVFILGLAKITTHAVLAIVLICCFYAIYDLIVKNS